MRAAVQTVDGTYTVDVEEETVVDFAAERTLGSETGPPLALPRVVSGAAAGSTVVAVVDRRPPVLVSNDAGTTWREAGGGLPAGRAIAIADDDPDLMLYAARNRLYVSQDGGRFWRALAPELPEIEAVAWLP